MQLSPLFQPCKQGNNQWQQREGRQEKHVKQLAFPFIQRWAAPQGWGFLLFIIILFLLHIFFVFCQGETLVFYREQLGSRIPDTGVSVCVNQEPDFQQRSVFHRLIFLPYPPSCHTKITQPVCCSKKEHEKEPATGGVKLPNYLEIFSGSALPAGWIFLDTQPKLLCCWPRTCQISPAKQCRLWAGRGWEGSKENSGAVGCGNY